MRVSTVVVTYNRYEMLAKSLRALLAQTRVPDEILVIDNASTDETPALFASDAEFDDPLIHYIRLAKNLGGAGGFKEGMRRAAEAGNDWCWIMDDDGRVLIYYATADTRLHVAVSDVDRLTDYCLHTPEDGLTTAASVETIKRLIAKNHANEAKIENR